MRIAHLTLALALVAGISAKPVLADSGSYLAARSAMISNDYAEAAQYYAQALTQDPTNPEILENAVNAYIGLGDLERATAVAKRLVDSGSGGQIAGLVLYGDSALKNEWDRLLDYQTSNPIGPLFDGLSKAWALVGKGQMTEAIGAFDDVSATQGVESFGLYHKALALSSVGDFEGAAEILSGDTGTPIRLTRRGVVAYAQVLSQLERNTDASELITASFGTTLDPYLEDVKTRLDSGETVAFDTVRNATEGMAEVYYSIATALRGEAQDPYTLIYTRMAAAMRPDHVDSLLLSAELLENLERYDLATAVYDSVPRDNPSFHAAELGRAEALRRSGREDAAIEVLNQLAKTHAHLPLIHVTLGDALRGMNRFEESLKAYNAAVDLIETPEEQHWIIFYARAIAHERSNMWPEAEADFRKALELRPEQPQVLNYLGYSFLEMQTNYDEAIDMIERAVALRPDSGYIIDSLGWGLYRLGRYDEAVGHMEKAVESQPIDPIINDHLGDVYYAVGRKREAEFQWHRALSFITDETDTDDVDPDRIRRKLDVGLDAVLVEEGAPPLKVANDDG